MPDRHGPAPEEHSIADADPPTASIPVRIDRLAARAAADAIAFEPPARPPDPAAAMRYLREGVGAAISVYIDARSRPVPYRFAEREHERLEAAMNTWLGLYAACYDIDTEPSVAVRTAAEALLETNDLGAVARILTGVGEPSRDVGDEPL